MKPFLLATTLGGSLLLAGPALAQHHGHHGHGGAAADAARDATPSVPPATKVDHSAMGHAPMEASAVDHSTMDHSAMDHSKMDHSKMDHSSMDHSTMDHSSAGQHHGHASTLPREPIPAITDADRAAAFPAIDHSAMQHASTTNSLLLFNRLEHWNGGHGQGQAWEASGWVGGDIHRLWVRSEGERQDGTTEHAYVELLYGRSVSPWWDVVAGVRQDTRPRSRSWAAIGVQGLAPYKFETSATLYLGEGGQALLNGEVEYEILLTNRLILQPLLEVELAARDEPVHGIGSGLTKAEAGLRLRYEISRRFAPYVGIGHERSFGDTADLQRSQGHRARDTRWMAGVRVWF